MPRWEPKVNETYYLINSRFQVRKGLNTGSKKSFQRIIAGNAFRTAKEAQDAQRLIYEALRVGKVGKHSIGRFIFLFVVVTISILVGASI